MTYYSDSKVVLGYIANNSRHFYVLEMLTNGPELHSDVKSYATLVEKCTSIGSEHFSRFSQWSILQRAIARLITSAQSRSKAQAAQEKGPPTRAYEQAKVVILRCVQYEAFMKEIECLKHSEKLPRSVL